MTRRRSARSWSRHARHSTEPDRRPPLGPRHAEVRRLRDLVRHRSARQEARLFVVDSPRVIAAGLDRGARFVAAYRAPGAEHGFAALLARLDAAGVSAAPIREGVLERIGASVTPQPVLAVAPLPTVRLGAIPAEGPVLVGVGIGDPGNAGALVRSAEAAGMAAVVFCGGSVDVHNPKAVRASAGAVFGVLVADPVLDGEDDDPVTVLTALGDRRRYGAVAEGGASPESIDLTGAVALVLGSEAHGLAPAVDAMCDAHVTIPMTGGAESLNVAMAGTVLAFEAARQARAAGRCTGS